MYGCLGIGYSRFYARSLAALFTHMGREILQHTKELAETMHLDVLYGDTDSRFVNSTASELSEALRISNEFKVVNEQYRKLEIDFDAIFQRLLLLQKKKYAAVKLGNGAETSIEVKGLDMKRREYCALSKNVSQFMLEQILSGTYRLDEYVINKRLGKNPEDYPKAEGQPHVQVALKMKAKGGNARAGDVIPYVFCLANGEQPTKTGQSDRARHRDEQSWIWFNNWSLSFCFVGGGSTRMMGIYGQTCLRPGCFNKFTFEYSDEKLYTQLRYYTYLIDGERAVKNSAGTAELEVRVAGQCLEGFSNTTRPLCFVDSTP
ncbi:hypothetical protein C8R41DRAFT_867133 [Lentinula lateritia]|uniref:DNA-directed DNA polymerase n=1 Tax=Lentinula lateritia TaxID=40482 RepID=A0ABQ8VJ18_9AGAR|nr:hypothetical protein C8R41DRAFT_867133 [Lentinula lateritia]